MELVSELLAASGMVVILRHGRIFSSVNIPLRNVAHISSWIGMIFSCALCLGVWAGAAVRFGSMQPELAVNTGLIGGAGGFVLGALLVQDSWSRLLAWFLL
ncbi:MAG: hypothetical protein A2W05_08805 [Candidatus Schekmanbacteria bacterium RBG_16_38_10]|uniref:Uncharacterized protein n=1 Tax=Candidatus Schekmanbacteria bacterium RBG_16_38_10 TaxID=1817879 RepID=A0A1F7RQ96_9BACT|nr:MAG: hypothetical protein A2W05_08805 [Candidatus Schekmanbacteria bacterium RBG_16_38_10]